MKSEEALQYAKGGLEVYQRDYPELITQIEFQKLVIKALEKQEKYKRHDLRKNPNDLPTKDGEYLIYFEFGDEIRSAVREYIYREKAFSCAVVPIAWRYIEPFGEDNE